MDCLSKRLDSISQKLACNFEKLRGESGNVVYKSMKVDEDEIYSEEEEYYDEDEHEEEMRAVMGAVGDAASKVVKRSVAKVGEYLSLISNIGETNNDQLELDRILSGEMAVQAQGDISPLQLDSGKEEGPDNKKSSDAEEV